MTHDNSPPSPELTDAQIDVEIDAEAELEAIMAAEAEPAPVETISMGELLLLSIDKRFGRIANALEKDVTVKHELTAQVARLANAFENVAALIGCALEPVTGEDGFERCLVRTRDITPYMLAQQDDRED